jgi:Ser/Thr protein kinase RdoA (MazF antagonist)
MSHEPGDPGLPPGETRAAGALLSAAWGEPVAVLAAEALRDRTHVFRLRLDGGRSAVLKRRGPRDQARGAFGIELAALEYLSAMPEPVAPRLLGADAEAGLLLMEDLGPGRSLADSLLAGSPEAAQGVHADLVAYARALGALHAWSRERPAAFAALRARHAPGAALEPAWLGAVGRGRAGFLAVAAGLGLPTAGVEDEIKTITNITNGAAFPGLVHGDACPDNVRMRGGECLIFDFESSGWGPVTLDAAYLLAPFPSCWCFGRLPAGAAAAALDAYRARVGEAGIELGPDWDAAMAAAMAVWVIARGTALREALGEDDSWGTTTIRPRLLAWLRSFAAAAGRAGTLPRLRALAADLEEVLSQRWPQVRVPDYPALAGPGAVLARVPDWWQPEG